MAEASTDLLGVIIMADCHVSELIGGGVVNNGLALFVFTLRDCIVHVFHPSVGYLDRIGVMRVHLALLVE